jgi:general secretion pathway protein G
MIAARSAPGFALIELVITVAIIGLLAGIAVPTAELVIQRNREQELRLALREIRKGIDAYKQAFDEGHMVKMVGDSGYPPTLNVLVDGVPDALNPDQQKIYFLRRIPPDPMSTDLNLPPEKTWGLRSYESDADNPSEGKDVFDVYTLATGIGINRVPYRQW